MARSQKSQQRDRPALVPSGSYEVLAGLTYPSDPAVVKRIRNGDHVPLEDRKLKRAEPGDIVSDIPDCSIADLLAKGAIRVLSEDLTPFGVADRGESDAREELTPFGAPESTGSSAETED